MAELRLVGLTKRYGEVPAVEALDLEIDAGELLTLLGPSGSGKTTVLRLIAGFLEPDSGRIVLGERDVSRDPPEKRDIGMVFQSYALFPHRNVFRNVAFGLERRKVGRREREERVRDALQMVHLGGLDERYPHELSGGQQQRVALARALVIRPTLLLLDEPLSNLDAKLRSELRLEIRRIQRELAITTVLVTHDQEEALTVSDRIALIRKGRLQQVDTARALYRHPANRFVASFIGRVNLFPATRIGRGIYRIADGATLRGPEGHERTLLAVRPEVIRANGSGGQSVNRVSGIVEHRVFLGELVEMGVLLKDGTRVLARGSESALPPREPGSRAELSWPVEATQSIDDET